MFHSMTGFGKASCETTHSRYTFEIKSLNSKGLDLNFRPGNFFGEREMAIRNELAGKLIRGKVDINIVQERKAQAHSGKLNFEVVAAYLEQLRDFATRHQLHAEPELTRIAFSLPGALNSETETLSETDLEELSLALFSAVEQLLAFREQEGARLREDVEEKIRRIELLRIEIQPLLPERAARIRQRLQAGISEGLPDWAPDQNRLEQEMIFYLEKLDVNEEMVRLGNHLTYFSEACNQAEAPGRKLAFIVQEIGREINTLGSKANHAEIQKKVVEMKNEMEKVREQLLNIL
jgi:uncharacterized protein (TIGR00255 family)